MTDNAERAPTVRTALDAEYELLRELGLGGTAIVYLARNKHTGEEVAIKLIRATYLEDAEALARFAREARFASRLDHPNIVPVREVLPLGGGSVALIMPHIAGRTLKQLIRDVGPLPLSQTEQVLRDVAAGLSAAHRMDIVHRDVKPENIFIDVDGRALLADFGLARSMTVDTRLTMTGVAIGTPTYMPPEQIDGGTMDVRGDVYSLGLVAWEMVTGRRPWDGDSLYALLYHQKHDLLPDVRDLRSDVPDRLAQVIATAIEKEPQSRWQTVDDMVAALDSDATPRPLQRRAPVSSDTMQVDRGMIAKIADPALRPVQSDDERLRAFDQMIEVVATAEEENAIASRRRRAIVAGALAAVVTLGLGVYGLRSHRHGTNDIDSSVFIASSPGTLAPSSASPVQTAASGSKQTDSIQTSAPNADSSVTLAGTAVASNTAVEGAGDMRTARSLVSAPLSAPPRTTLPAATGAASGVAAAKRGMIAAGGMHSCLVTADGHGYCWGANTRGQLGTNGGSRATLPAPVGANLEITSIAAGLSHTCALAQGGAAWCWGANDEGQLGDRSNAAQASPVRVADGHLFRSIVAGASHSCALDTEGGAWCWGAGSRGQLGNGGMNESDAPVAVPGARFTQLAAGWNFTCGLDAAGHAYCWGENDAGQLGDRDTADHPLPVPVATDRVFVRIAAGHGHACAVTVRGEAYCWGDNSSGQLGDGTMADHLTPTRVAGSNVHWASLTAGAVHTCGIDDHGQAYCWGLGIYGQLGDGSSANQLVPARVDGAHTFDSLRAFGSHTCGTTVEGEEFCWGYNLEGQLGDGTRVNRSRPVYVEPPAGP